MTATTARSASNPPAATPPAAARRSRAPERGPGGTARLVATRADTLGFAGGFVVGDSVAEGMETRVVARIDRGNPTAVVRRGGSPVRGRGARGRVRAASPRALSGIAAGA